MKRFFINILTVFGMLILFMSMRAFAAETVNVTIVQTPVQIANISVYSPQVEYPVIMYKDICYIPMTYNLCENINLAVGFDSEKGLFITRHINNDAKNTLPFGNINCINDTSIKHTAYIPEYPIYLNGVLIDNKSEEYPILNFRDITYFPLTYRFATEEFDIQVMQSEQYFIIANPGEHIYSGDYATSPDIHYFGECDDGSIDIITQTYGSTTYIENGIQQSYGYYWWDTYKLSHNPSGDTLLKTATYTDYLTMPETPWEGDPPYSQKIKHENAHVYFDDTEVLNFEGRDFIGAHGNEFTFGDITFIRIEAAFGDKTIPVLRYPQLEEYIFIKKNDDISKLSIWDINNRLYDIYPDGCGGFYLSSPYYRPYGNSRFTYDIASVYHYTSNGEFYSLSVPDTNSVEAIGVHAGKLYVLAVYRQYNSSDNLWSNGTISAVNSGYYEIDIQTGNYTKLRPYFPAKTLLTKSGELYAIKEFGLKPKIMNIKTGEEHIIG